MIKIIGLKKTLDTIKIHVKWARQPDNFHSFVIIFNKVESTGEIGIKISCLVHCSTLMIYLITIITFLIMYNPDLAGHWTIGLSQNLTTKWNSWLLIKNNGFMSNPGQICWV
jgi:hypothetical protein